MTAKLLYGLPSMAAMTKYLENVMSWEIAIHSPTEQAIDVETFYRLDTPVFSIPNNHSHPTSSSPSLHSPKGTNATSKRSRGLPNLWVSGRLEALLFGLAIKNSAHTPQVQIRHKNPQGQARLEDHLTNGRAAFQNGFQRY